MSNRLLLVLLACLLAGGGLLGVIITLSICGGMDC